MDANVPQNSPNGTVPVLGPDGSVLNKQQLAAKLVLHRIANMVADGYPIYRPSYADVQFLTACMYGISTRHQLSPAQMKCLEILERKATAKIKVCREQRESTIENNAADAAPAATPAVPVVPESAPAEAAKVPPSPASVPTLPTDSPSRWKGKQVTIPVAKSAPEPAKPRFIDDEEAELDALESADFDDDSLPDVEVG